MLFSQASVVVSFVVERIYRKNGDGRLRIDTFLLKIPVLGDLLRRAAVARFTHTLSTLLQSGVPVIQSLDITQAVVGNRVIADATAETASSAPPTAAAAGALRLSGSGRAGAPGVAPYIKHDDLTSQ